jgi:hypothetical protein
MTKSTDIDWNEVEKDYRAGILSGREMADKYGCAESAIRYRAKRHGWVKGDPHEVRIIAQRKADDAGLPMVPVDPAERIEELGTIAGTVLVEHRKSLALLRGIAVGLSDELLAATQQRDLIEDRIIEFYAAKAEMSPAQAATYRKQMQLALGAVSLGSRSKTAMNLANTMRMVIDGERTNYRLDEEKGDKSYEELLAEIHAAAVALKEPDDPSGSDRG